MRPDKVARVKPSSARRSRALLIVVLAGLGFATATAGPLAISTPARAATASDPRALTPTVDCVSAAPGATPDAFTVVFGYNNGSGHIDLPAGSPQNSLSLTADRGQPTSFATGEHHAVYATTFAGTATDLVWTLGGGAASVGPSTPSCETATTVTLSLPAGVSAGDQIDMTASVGRMLLAAPTDGSVEFSVDASVAAVVPVDNTGIARAAIDAPAAGQHTVTARYVPVLVPAAVPGPAAAAATPQLLGSTATAAINVGTASAISIASSGLSADGRTARFTVTRTGTAGPARVDYVTADGSAQAGRDYTSSRGTVRFASGQSSATISIPLLARPFGSVSANFFVLLQRASGTVDTAGASAVLPQVTAVSTTPNQGLGPAGFVSLPTGPGPGPTDPLPATGGTNGGGTDLALMFGGLLLTVGAALGVIGLARFGASRKASDF